MQSSTENTVENIALTSMLTGHYEGEGILKARPMAYRGKFEQYRDIVAYDAELNLGVMESGLGVRFAFKVEGMGKPRAMRDYCQELVLSIWEITTYADEEGKVMGEVGEKQTAQFFTRPENLDWMA